MTAQKARREEQADMAEPPDSVVLDAIRSSNLSPCQSKRGAVVFLGDTVFTSGCNHQVPPFTCDSSSACKAHCRRTAVHAEQVALNSTRQLVRGCDLLHVKTIYGRLVPSGQPSCVECSKLAVLAGIAGVWLYHVEGWRRYDVLDFHRLSVENLR
jgi:deoxycytidylate deaminase